MTAKKTAAFGAILGCVLIWSFPSWGADGHLKFLARTQGPPEMECPFWITEYHGSGKGGPFGSCAMPAIDVYVELEGASAGGITGVEFAGQIGPDNSPDLDWLLLELPNPTANIVLGSAFVPPDPAPRGLNIAWSSCQNDGGRVHVLTVLPIALRPCGPGERPPSLSLSGVQHSSPSNVFFRCPLVTLCDAPAFTKVCLGDNIVDCETPVPPFPIASKCSTSGEFVINPRGHRGLNQCERALATGSPKAANVAEESWSSVKALYR
jgi:hypothetical protein